MTTRGTKEESLKRGLRSDCRLPNSAVIGRMPKYLALVEKLDTTGVEWTKSHTIASELDLVSATVRRDFQYLSCHGLPNHGYLVKDLRASLIECMGLSQPQNLAVVGAGNLGTAVATHLVGRNHEFRVAGIYDIAPEIIGSTIAGVKISALTELERDAKLHSISLAVLTVHEKSAQSVANLLASLDIGILNLSSGGIRVDDRVPVVDTQIVNDLRLLSLLSVGSTRDPAGDETPELAEWT